MELPFLLVLLLLFTASLAMQDLCPGPCTCETLPFSQLSINSVLVNSEHKPKLEDPSLVSYQNRNEVLDETDEKITKYNENEQILKAATCVLQPETNLPLFLSLPHDLEALTILHGPMKTNITLDELHFQHLQKLLVLEIHGYPQGAGALRLRKNALKHLEDLRYINFQHLHLLGDQNTGNRPVPISVEEFLDHNTIAENLLRSYNENNEEISEMPGIIQFLPIQNDEDIVPYNVYRAQQELAGLSTFAGLKNLVYLRAFHCNIKEVNWEMFDGLDKLEYLSLEGNKIPFINEFAFYGTPNLKHLTMSHNKILDVHSFGFAGLLELEVLDLSYNNISHLSEFSLPPFPKLVTADFHHNPLETILPHTFEVTNNTDQLYLGGKSAKLIIMPNTFAGLRKLKKLSVSGIFLEVLESEHLKGMHALRELRIEGILHELAFDAFAEVPKLQELILKHCSIQKVSMDAFFGLYNLLYLDLSHNELDNLPPHLFSQQKSLKELYINNNKLTTLPEGLLLPIPAKLIRLNNNPWHCTCLLNNWQPSQINKIKTKIMDDSECQTRYDKGSMCKIRYMYQYRYDQSVSPRCTTPTRFSGWSVFHLMRKNLRCHDIPKTSKIIKLQKLTKPTKSKPYSKNRINNTMYSENQPNLISSHGITSEHLPTTPSNVEPMTNEHSTVKKSTTLASDTTIGPQNNKQVYKNIATETSYSPSSTNYLKIINPQARNIRNNNIESETEKSETEKIQQNFKINIDLKTKKTKQSTAQKKWELKMENTKKRLNVTQEHTKKPT